MAEKEEGHGHINVNKRSTYANRGRPRRLYHHLGVRDLREILDRKRSEREHDEPNIPPSDPSYNYLKDPLRENADNLQEHSPRLSNTKKNYSKNHSNNNFKKDREYHGGNASNYPKNKDIENPLNITVEFSTSTGEHIYKVDDSTVLPTIKHVPDRLPFQNRPFRGRGRGRGRGQRIYQTRTVRNKKHIPANLESQKSQVAEAQQISVSVEENWDEELNQSKEVDEESEDYKQEELHDYEDEEEHLHNRENLEKTEAESLEKGVQELKLDQSSEKEVNEAQNKN